MWVVEYNRYNINYMFTLMINNLEDGDGFFALFQSLGDKLWKKVV